MYCRATAGVMTWWNAQRMECNEPTCNDAGEVLGIHGGK